jgi:manganese transport protein
MDQALARARSLSDRTLHAGREVLAGRLRGWRAILPFAGPAVITSIAYMDPGNFATNIQAGASYGYVLLWVVVVANLVAMLFQALSAKLGIVTGRNLAELSRDLFPHPVVISMWIASEFAAMATDLAEFLGGAIGLSLLLHLPLLVGMAVTGVATLAILTVQGRGFRPIELVIGGMVALIGLCYVVELFIAPPAWGVALFHMVVPQLPDANAVTLSVGIIGATVMPHAIYLHSSLTQNRIRTDNDTEKARVISFSNREVLIALAFAGLVNMAMLMMAAAVFHDGVHNGVAEIQTAYTTLTPLLGAGAAGVFMLSLIVSGLSSSTVGTMAGQVIMQGFVRWTVPIWLRRLITMVPAFIVIALGVNATTALVASQVALSLVLPVPMVALLIITNRRSVMGSFVNRRLLRTTALAATIIVICLNILLIWQTAANAATPEPTTTSVVLSDYRFTPSTILLRKGRHYRLHLDNRGSEAHEFTAAEFFKTVTVANPKSLVADGHEAYLPPHTTDDILLTPLRSGEFSLSCADHDWMGMVGKIVVK